MSDMLELMMNVWGMDKPNLVISVTGWGLRTSSHNVILTVFQYIRVDVDTKMSDMLELMMNVWGMDKPNLVISVTGGGGLEPPVIMSY